tara:strand:+ start:590 stop:835 length:246 start_codon:yes stop_codon:yes gene_type:complete
MDVEGLERKKHENFYNYTDDQLLEKQLALKTLKELYPDVPTYYADIVYDLCKNSTDSEIDAIKNKVETIPFKYASTSKEKM